MEFKNVKQLKKLYEEAPGYLVHGIYFGFPLCCIEAFCTGETQKVIKKYPKLPSSGTGFVPCLKCAKKVKLDWESYLKKEIIENRFCPAKFPSDEDVNEKHGNLKFFIKLTRFLGYDPKEECANLHEDYEKTILKLLKKEEKEIKQADKKIKLKK